MPENRMPVRLYGNSPQIEENLGLDEFTSRKLAAIIIYSGSIEYHLERAIWRLEGIDPAGIRPSTDGKPISALIDMLEKLAPPPNKCVKTHWLTLWCKAARSAFVIRNNIVHGVAGKMGDTISFSRNPRWEGENRKRGFGDFWCNRAELEFTADSFATLLKLIMQVAKNERTLDQIGHEKALKALREAKSILGEFADQYYNPTFEKY